MWSFLKWIGGGLFLTLPFAFSIRVSTPTETDFGAATSLSFSRFETRVSEIATAVKRRFASRVEAQPMGASFLASDPRHLEVRDRFLADHFQPHGGHYHCTLSSGGKTRQAEIRGLKLDGPFPLSITPGESIIGISARLEYQYRAQSHRTSPDGTRWGEWSSGIHPALDRLTMTLQNDQWSVDPDNITPISTHPLRER